MTNPWDQQHAGDDRTQIVTPPPQAGYPAPPSYPAPPGYPGAPGYPGSPGYGQPGPTGYAQAGYPQPGYGGYPPAPQKSKTGLIAGVIAAIVIVGLVVGLLIWQPWSSSDDTGGTSTAAAREEFLLDQDITVIVEVPGGWRAEATSFDGDRIVMLLPDSESRSADTVLADADHPETAGGTHAVLARVDECDASSSAGYQSVDTWRLGNLKSDADGSVQNAAMRVNGLYCLGLVGVDMPAGSTPAGDLVRASAVDGNTIFTARVTIN